MKILIAIDGSALSKSALKLACKVGDGKSDVEFKVLTAYEVPAPVAAAPFVPMSVYTQTIVDDLRVQAEEIAASATAELKRHFPNARVSASVVLDEPGGAIVSKAHTWQPDMIIVGSHGYGMIGRVLLGSVSDYVVHHAPCSVLVARPPIRVDEIEHLTPDNSLRNAPRDLGLH